MILECSASLVWELSVQSMNKMEDDRCSLEGEFYGEGSYSE